MKKILAIIFISAFVINAQAKNDSLISKYQEIIATIQQEISLAEKEKKEYLGNYYTKIDKLYMLQNYFNYLIEERKKKLGVKNEKKRF